MNSILKSEGDEDEEEGVGKKIKNDKRKNEKKVEEKKKEKKREKSSKNVTQHVIWSSTVRKIYFKMRRT